MILLVINSIPATVDFNFIYFSLDSYFVFVVVQSIPLNCAASGQRSPSHTKCWNLTQSVIFPSHNLVTLCLNYHCIVILASCNKPSHLHRTDSSHMDWLTHTFSSTVSSPSRQHSLLHTMHSAWNHSNAYWRLLLILDVDLFTLKVTRWAACCSGHYSPADLPQPKSLWMTTTKHLKLSSTHRHVLVATLWFKFNLGYHFGPRWAASMHLLVSSKIDLTSLLITTIIAPSSPQPHMNLD